MKRNRVLGHFEDESYEMLHLGLQKQIQRKLDAYISKLSKSKDQTS